ncbi:TetR/AcrR family transcriptional regulator [Candidatus Litorirhabdus singularis]|nr:TetR/AcrR family transcriptional regulator [Candidatus Litorirhabdus singularis]
MTTATESTVYQGAALALLETAEQLFAEHGVDAVSTREIARTAGQKNHSAVAYHFGSKGQLIAAILELRLPAINERRQQLLTFLHDAGQSHNLRAIVGALVIPFVEQLRSDNKHNHYVGFIGQLSAQRHDELNHHANPQHTTATRKLSRLMAAALADIPRPLFYARTELMAAQLYQSLALWDARRRAGDPEYADQELGWRTENLIDFISAGLASPVSGPTRRQLKSREE